MRTVFILMAQYDGLAVVPTDRVVADYFPHLTRMKFLRKISAGEIKLPVVRSDPKSQKSARGISIQDLANYLDERRSAAVKEMEALTR
ncbi:pyocin activator PrtN family protein [Roseibium aggregatum]|nr:pyocin activator PrtN family protein [Roseibium aggregatum]